MPLLETRHLSFSYEKGSETLKNINLSFEKGTFTALLGANGCGKTTLVQHLNGLIKPAKGQVLLKGRDIGKLKEKEVFESIGLVFQNPEDQLICYTVYEDLAFGVKNLGITAHELDTRVREAAGLMNISDLLDKEIHKLSFGQKKRTAIAGILAMRPQVILMDEPTAGLDPMTSSSLLRTLKEISLKEGTLVVIATHEVDLVPVFCDYVYVVSQGQITLEGKPEKVFLQKDILRNSNLRLPRIGHLMEILKEKDNLLIDSFPMTIKEARKALIKLLSENPA